MLDLKYAIRQLLRSPMFTCVAILTLGLCMGANLTIFAMLDAILVRELPFPQPDRLVVLNNVYPGAAIERAGASIANYFERRDTIDSFESVSMIRLGSRAIGEGQSMYVVKEARVTPEFFETLGISLAMGQTFSEADFDWGKNTIISDRFWRDHFNADPDVLGMTMTISGYRYTVIGVSPPGFRYLSSDAEVYTPFGHYPNQRLPDSRHANDGEMVARLKDNRSIADAQAQLDVLNARLLADDPIADTIQNSGFRTLVASLHKDHVRTAKPVLMLVQAGALCLLLIGVANLAGLIMIRASGNTKEIAVHMALGAGRWHVVRKVLLETSLLSLAGSAIGITLAIFCIKLTELMGADAFPLAANIAFDGRTAIVSFLAAIVLSSCLAVPAIWLNWGRNIGADMHSETRSGTSSWRVQHLRHGLIVAQIAVAFVLLCGAGLLSMSLKRALETPTGFETEQTLTAEAGIQYRKYPLLHLRRAIVERMLDSVRALPGVTYASVSSGLPFTRDGSVTSTIFKEGLTPDSGGSQRAHYISSVTTEYRNVMGIPLRAGRFIEGADCKHDRPRVAVIDEALADQYWPNGDAVGKRFSTHSYSLYQGKLFSPAASTFNESRAYTIVGVVGNVKQTDLTESQGTGTIYLPYTHSLRFHLVLRTSVTPIAMISSVRDAVKKVDPELPVENFKTMGTHVQDSLVVRRSPMILASVFAGVALLLASIGIYGALAYAAAQRRREIGVRMALGAMPEQIGRQFLSLGLRLFTVGTLFGCFGAWTAGRAMRNILFEVPSIHVPTFAGTTIVLSVVTLLACLAPAIRAARVDPMEALRGE